MQCFQILNEAIFRRCFEKTLTSMFLTMFEKNWNIVLTMHLSNVFGNHFKRIKIAVNHLKFVWQIVGLSEYTFWNLKTSCKTSHFLLNDAMFQRCFEKTLTLMFLMMFEKRKHHINNVNHPPLPPIVGLHIYSDQLSDMQTLLCSGGLALFVAWPCVP